MKLKTTLSAALLAAATAMSINALAAGGDEPKAAADEAKAEKASPKKVKPHSHMEEKTGMPQKAADAKPEPAKKADKDKSKHFHPRDR